MAILDRLAAKVSALALTLKRWFPDLLLVAGAAGVAYGAWLAYAPAGFVVAGAFAIVAGRRLT